MENPIDVQCPWCGETFVTFFDASTGDQSYVEDCQVCCRPITMRFTAGGSSECGDISVMVERE
jgi:hypothetical protein